MLSSPAVIESSTGQISVALLPIGGRLDHDDPSGTYWGDEAACIRLGQPFHLPAPGERLTLPVYP